MSEWSQLLKIIIRQEILFDAPYRSLYSLRAFSLKNLFRNCREFQNFTLHVQQRPEFHLTEIFMVHLWLYKFTIFQWVKLSSLNEDLRYQILPAKLLLRSNWSSNWKGTLSLVEEKLMYLSFVSFCFAHRFKETFNFSLFGYYTCTCNRTSMTPVFIISKTFIRL